MKVLVRSATLALLLLLVVAHPSLAQSQEPTSARPATTEPAKATASKPAKAQPEQETIGGQLAKEEREATGAEEEENGKLKYSAMVKRLGKLLGLNVHQAHLLAMIVDFVLVAYGIFLVLRYGIPGMLPAAFGVLSKRGESIRHALEEARAASQDASRRLTEIENRLRQLDVEIGHIQASAEKEAEAEEARIKGTAEEDIRKVVEAAEQEIAAAARLARRELTAHTADLAIALARKQIHVDAEADQMLVHDFASKLSQGGKDGQ